MILNSLTVVFVGDVLCFTGPMLLRTRHISRFQIWIAAGVLAAGFLLGACGGGSSDDDGGSATSGGGEVDVEQAGEQEGSPAADTSDDAAATVVLDGTTYRFTSNPDATLKTRTYCSDLNGSLQGTLRLVDESGAFVEGGKVDFGLFDPDSDSIPAGVDPSVVVNLPSAPGVDGPVSYTATAGDIESEVSGRSATATFTARSDSGDVPGTIEVSC